MEEDHSDVGKDVGHHGVLEEVETVMKKVKFRFTHNIRIQKEYNVTCCEEYYETKLCFATDLFKFLSMRLSIISVNWEICCWPLLCSFVLVTFAFGFTPSNPPLGSWWALCSGKYTCPPLRIQCHRCQGWGR